MRLGAIWLPLSAVALIGAGCGAAQRDGGAWRPYQPAPAQPGQAWAEAQRAGDRQRAVNRGASTAATADSDRGDDAPAAQPSRPEPVSTTASRPERRSSAKRAPAAAEKASPRRVAAVERDTTGGSGGGARRPAGADATPPAKTRQAGADADAGADTSEGEADAGTREVIYLGYLRLEVARRVEALEAIEALLAKREGFIDRMAGNVVVVRVPAGDFDAAMDAFAAVGRVLDRRIQAVDVTAQFQDLGVRLDVARRARERLLELLKHTKDVEQRLRLVAEIKRLSNVIEEIEATLVSLRDMVAFQTITIELVARDQNGAGVWRRSPFPWVRALMPGRPGRDGPSSPVKLDRVEGFVVLPKARPYTARAADSSALTIWQVANEPAGDAAFWARAIAWELAGRGDEAVESGAAGGVAWQVWRARDPRPWTWLLAVRVVDDQVWVLDAFLPDPAAWERHGKALLDAARRFEVSP